jgi:hypothetical protein
MSGRLAATFGPARTNRSRILAVMAEEKIDIDERHRRALVVFQQLRGGRLCRSVVVSGVEGDWPPGTPNYYLDGVLFADHPKPGRRPVLRRLLAGRELPARSHPNHVNRVSGQIEQWLNGEVGGARQKRFVERRTRLIRRLERL